MIQVFETINQNKLALLLTCAIPETSTSDAQATPVATQTSVQLCAASGTPQHRSNQWAVRNRVHVLIRMAHEA